MPKIYSNFSNYDEINGKNRKQSAVREINQWGNEKQKFEHYRIEWNKAANENFLPANPLHVDIELSDVCNLRCKMCPHGMGTVKNEGLMKAQTVKKILDECGQLGVYSVKFNWRGEPTLSQDLPKYVAYAKSKGVLEVQINTNANTPPGWPDILLKCAENGIDRIIFSLDAFTKPTYEKIRIGGNFDKVIKNIHTLIAWKKEHKAIKPFTRVQMVRTILNAQEVSDFINYWQPLVDDVRISDVTDRGQGKTLAVGDQITIGRRRCPQPFQRLVVAKNGNVLPCCADWNEEFVVGNISKDSLSDIWKGQKMREMRKTQLTDKQDLFSPCKHCFVKESYIWKKREIKLK